jgi:hypothetical protein
MGVLTLPHQAKGTASVAWPPGTSSPVRLLLPLLTLLILGLLAQAIFDSAIGGWFAFGSFMAIVAVKALGWIGVWPEDWPDFDGGD